MSNLLNSNKLPLLLDLPTIKAEQNKRRANNLTSFVIGSADSYLAGWFHKDICERLQKFSEDVVAKKSPRLMLLAPPRHGKSFISSERFPVWHLGRNPAHQIVVVSYGQTLSNRFSRKARELSHTSYTSSVFPKLSLDPDKQAASEWLTSKGGGYRAVGIGGGLTGMGADILILDDLIKDHIQASSKRKRDADHEWYQTTGYTRLMPGGGVLLVQTRWHEDDLPGRLLEAFKSGEENADEFEIVSYPAIAEVDEAFRKVGEALHSDRYSITQLKNIKGNIGTKSWTSLYQQRPSTEEGNLIKRHWWQRYADLPRRFEICIISWDCAFKDTDDSDYVVAEVWGKVGADYYLIEIVRDRMDFVETSKQVYNLAMKYNRARPVLIEDKANGPAIISQLKSKVSGLIAYEPRGSKESRVFSITPLLEAGNVHIPYDGMDSFVEECASFPRGANDDQVDAMSQALNYLEEFGKGSYFSGLWNLFNAPEAFEEEPYVQPFRGNWYFGIYFDRETSLGAFVGISPEGIVGVVVELHASNFGSSFQRIRTAIVQSEAVEMRIDLEQSGHAETLYRQLQNEPWGSDLVEMDYEEAFDELKTAIEERSITLAQVDMLYDHLAYLRRVVTEKGTVVFKAPDGLSCPAAFALVIAYKSYKENKDNDMLVGTIDPFEFFNKAYED